MEKEERPVTEKYRKLIGAILGSETFSLMEIKTKVTYADDKLPIGTWELGLGKDRVAWFQLYPMINCCGICVSTNAKVTKNWQGKGLGKLLNAFRIDVARENGYSLLICTDIINNKYQRRILEANGWRDLVTFINRRTGNTVAISAINL